MGLNPKLLQLRRYLAQQGVMLFSTTLADDVSLVCLQSQFSELFYCSEGITPHQFKKQYHDQ